MFLKLNVTSGIIENEGTKKQKFIQHNTGFDLQVYIEFDNGSVLGYTTIKELSNYIEKTILEYNNIPDKNNF